VGFGGLGKTTLANEVYRSVKDNFECGAFVPVSQKPDIPKLIHKLIIDDIWDVQAWYVIKCAFPANDLGSRVVATTRVQDVAKACSPRRCDYILNMKPLGYKDSRRLFLGRIFGSEEACPHNLRGISVKILKKCGGLPLALISTSSLLASEGTEKMERWEHVRTSLGSGSNISLNRMRQILNLSYTDLPCHLKTCLLYIGMYPEDYTNRQI
jgi:disease resistance protein RPM1